MHWQTLTDLLETMAEILLHGYLGIHDVNGRFEQYHMQG